MSGYAVNGNNPVVTQGTPAADSGAWPVRITDGVDGVLVSPAGEMYVTGTFTTTPLTDPKTSHATSASLAPGGSVNLDSSQISSGKVGHLIQLIPSSSIPWKAVLQTVQNGAASGNKLVFFSTNGESIRLDKGVITQAESATVGLDGFRCVITNLDASKTADVYCTFVWDEV